MILHTTSSPGDWHGSWLEPLLSYGSGAQGVSATTISSPPPPKKKIKINRLGKEGTNTAPEPGAECLYCSAPLFPGC